MEHLSIDVLNSLLARLVPPMATVYMPLHRGSVRLELTDDRIRIKNLFRKAIGQLQDHPDGAAAAGMMEVKLQELLNQVDLWGQSGDGMLVCADSQNVDLYRLPISTEEYVAVDGCLHMAPVLGLLGDAIDFHVLVVAQHEPVLYRGDMYGLHAVDVGLPPTMEDGLRLDEPGHRGEQSRSTAGAGFNGRGGAHNPAQADRERFLRMLDKLVHEEVGHTPLVLAGVEDETAEFRSLTACPHVLPGHIPVSFGADRLAYLFAAAQMVIYSQLTLPEHQKVIAEYQSLRGAHPERTAAEPAVIARAAAEGRVDKLLVGMSRYTADTVYDDDRHARIVSFPLADAANRLIQEAAWATWRQGGGIINADEAEMPDGAGALASLRY